MIHPPLLLSLLFFLLIPTTPQCLTPSILTITTQGFAQGIPDTALIHLHLSSLSPTASQSSSTLRTTLQNLLSIISSFSIPLSQISILTITLTPITLNNITSYNSSQVIAVQLKGIISKEGVPIGTFIDQVTKVEGVGISGVRFEMGNRKTLVETARERAWKEGRQRAELFAGLGGFRIEKIKKVVEIEDKKQRRKHEKEQQEEGKIDVNKLMGWRHAIPTMYDAKVTVTIEYTLSF